MTVTLPLEPAPGGSPRSSAGAQAAVPHVTVVTERCAGCQECAVRCPTGALTMDVATWTIVADDLACAGCRQCVRTCPFSAITVSGPLMVRERTFPAVEHTALVPGDVSETRKGFARWEEALSEAERCLQCPDPTCVRGCPTHNDIPGFVSALAAGDLEGAHAVLRRTSFLPDVCSRVCDQAVQCEGACTWSLAGGTPVAIGALERFVTENAPVPALARTDDAGAGLDVAVVGSGPAGIGAAWTLASSGAQVTVYERDDKPGGLLGWGIPDFTLPAAVAERPWAQLLEAGVKLRCGTAVDPSKLDGLLAEHDAVVLAVGAGAAMRVPLKGGDLPQVIDATQFLTAAETALRYGTAHPALGEIDVTAPKRSPLVLVVGGGNTAMDVARSVRRFGARAMCVEWMDQRFAPVRPDELAEATSEGVDVRFATTLVRLEPAADGVVAHLQSTRQKRAGARPVPDPASDRSVSADLVVMAMGYRNYPDFAALLAAGPIRRVATGLADRRWQASGILAAGRPEYARHQPVGNLALGRELARVTAALTVRDRVWMAGDALVGPSTVVEAMAQGRRAAEAVLARGPRRNNGQGGTGRPTSVLIAVESRGGTTKAKGEELAEALRAKGIGATVCPLSGLDTAQLSTADMLVVGTWVEGAVVAAVHPARNARLAIKRLPSLGQTPVAVFCTYGVHPRHALTELSRSMEGRGGKVVASAAFGPRAGDSIASFAEALVGSPQ